MYRKNEDGSYTLVDRRELLKIKLKSLAAEARIIRHAEKKAFGDIREQMHQHRIHDIRHTARHTHIAYGLIRGRTLEQMENSHKDGKRPLDWNAIDVMLKKYGPKDRKLNKIEPVRYEVAA